ncbi:hypothetical protein F2Q69_00012553 [Brassica cretica]|uniref:Uncharacterized protein n=1 Tax=Brassica cretica TaxID=69181 RepID=A0A8S9R9C6_BRACR|nr:hypothetical protein F2Q69_00012553 [Brassica cretica]
MESLRRYVVEDDEQHVSGELSRVEEAGTEDRPQRLPTTGLQRLPTTELHSLPTAGLHSIPTAGLQRLPTTRLQRRQTDIADSTHKSIDVSSCSPSPDVEKGITMEDSLELEEFLELEDGEKFEDMDQNLKKKLDDDQHTSRGDLETSKASIDRHQPYKIDRQPPHIIDLHPPDIDRHR